MSQMPHGLTAIFEASKLSQPLSTPCTTPILYTHTLCPYAERVLLTLLERVRPSTHTTPPINQSSQGEPFQCVHVDLANKPSWYRRVNPRGLVPALAVTDTRVLVESADICLALAREHQAVDPSTDYDVDGVVSAGLRCLAGNGRSWGIQAPPSPNAVATLEAHLARLESHLAAHKGPYLGGTRLAVSDVLLYPFMRRFSVALRRFSSVDMTAGRPCLAQWMAAMAARPSVQLAAADDALLEQAYVQHGCLDFFDYESYCAAALHPQLARFVVDP